MGTTVSGLPFPDGDDALREGDNSIQALAEAVDARLAGVVDTTPGVIISGNGVRRVMAARIRVVGSLAVLNMQLESGTFPTSSATGNIADISFYTLESQYRPRVMTPFWVYQAYMGVMGNVNTSGTMSLKWMTRTKYKLPSLTALYLSMAYELANPVYP